MHLYFPGRARSIRAWARSSMKKMLLQKKLLDQANEIVGFKISETMISGTAEDLKQTNVTQPAIFLHSVIAFKMLPNAKSEMVAGHSLGEFSALTCNGTLSFEDALGLVVLRANAMQKACEKTPSAMAAILALDDEQVETICTQIQQETGEIVVPANYNCPGQLVISGTVKGVEIGCERMKAAGAKRALPLPVGGAFHSPLMEPAKQELKTAIEKTVFHQSNSHIYQNISAKAVFDRDQIKQNLIDQLTGPVRWTQSIQAMIADGANTFTEVGPGKVLQGLILKIDKTVAVDGVS